MHISLSYPPIVAYKGVLTVCFSSFYAQLTGRHLIHYARSATRIDKTGWLFKRGYLNPSYKRRYFVLKGNMLFYFKSDDYINHDPIGVVLMESYTIGLGQPSGDLYCLQVRLS